MKHWFAGEKIFYLPRVETDDYPSPVETRFIASLHVPTVPRSNAAATFAIETDNHPSLQKKQQRRNIETDNHPSLQKNRRDKSRLYKNKNSDEIRK